MRSHVQLIATGVLAAAALLLPMVVVGSPPADATAVQATASPRPSEGDEHGVHDVHDAGMTDAEMADMDRAGDSHDAPGAPVVATPDDTGRTVVLAGFAAINVLVLVLAGVLRAVGHGRERRHHRRTATPLVRASTDDAERQA